MISRRVICKKGISSFLSEKASFITYPATQTHMDIPEEIRIANGVCNRLLRFSVGIEHAEDLKEDLKQALCQVKEGAVSFE